eukprot:273014-Prorocentrum_minimum.AAC.3
MGGVVRSREDALATPMYFEGDRVGKRPVGLRGACGDGRARHARGAESVGLHEDVKPLLSRSTTGEFNSPPKSVFLRRSSRGVPTDSTRYIISSGHSLSMLNTFIATGSSPHWARFTTAEEPLPISSKQV